MLAVISSSVLFIDRPAKPMLGSGLGAQAPGE